MSMNHMKAIWMMVVAVVALMLVSCSSFEVTTGVDNAWQTMYGIEFHDRAYMEKQPIKVSANVKEENFGRLAFSSLPGFRQNYRNAKDKLDEKQISLLRNDFETCLVSTNRFLVAQIRYGLADEEVRQATAKGPANVEGFDSGKLKKPEYVLNVVTTWTTRANYNGGDKTINNTMEWNVTPAMAANNAPMEEFPPFKVSVEDQIKQKVNHSGAVIAGPRLKTKSENDDYIINLGRLCQIKVLDHIYRMYPAGGEVTSFMLASSGPSLAKINASRATGLMCKMEMIVYALPKDDPDGIRIPLFNATVTPARIGSSELEIWRENSDNPFATPILKMLRVNPQEAKKTYDFYAASDGIAEKPDFIVTN